MIDESFCLAKNVYFEDSKPTTCGQLAVVSVTINRVNDKRFPNTICGVVYEGTPPKLEGQHCDDFQFVTVVSLVGIVTDCQTVYDLVTFDRIYTLTSGIVDGSYKVADITEGATHYHADYVEPAWAKTKTKTIEMKTISSIGGKYKNEFLLSR